MLVQNAFEIGAIQNRKVPLLHDKIHIHLLGDIFSKLAFAAVQIREINHGNLLLALVFDLGGELFGQTRKLGVNVLGERTRAQDETQKRDDDDALWLHGFHSVA